METRVWIDDPNPIYRRGLVSCLRRTGFVLVGESAGFLPPPDLDRTDILVFDLGEQSLGWALGRAGERRPARLLGLVGPGGPDRELARGLCTVVVRAELTPATFVDCLLALAQLSSPPADPDAMSGPGSRRGVAGLVGRLARTMRDGAL